MNLFPIDNLIHKQIDKLMQGLYIGYLYAPNDDIMVILIAIHGSIASYLR